MMNTAFEMPISVQDTGRCAQKVGFLGGWGESRFSARMASNVGYADLLESSGRERENAHRRLFLGVSGTGVQMRRFDGATIVVRGLLRFNQTAKNSLDHAESDDFARIYRFYAKCGTIPYDRLEGSFTIAILDTQKQKILLYRNLVGYGFTYYCKSTGSFIFGSNLAEVIRCLDKTPNANLSVLPSYFLYRFVPGAETLFETVYRLRPGELLVHDAFGLSLEQVRTFCHFEEATKTKADSVDRLEDAMREISEDYAADDHSTAVLLSGGVDSSYLQAHWNHSLAERNIPPKSIVVRMDHEGGREEGLYAASAAKFFGTEHYEVLADRPYSEYFLDAIRSTGEPPNHAQAVYYPLLGQGMLKNGIDFGICGQGADALFGCPLGDLLFKSEKIASVMPNFTMRAWLARMADRLGKEYLAWALRLVGEESNFAHPLHPVNHADTFTHWPSVTACFGKYSIERASASRRELLERYQTRNNPLHAMNAIMFLGDSYDAASHWTTLANTSGAELRFPFLDSRLLRVVMNIDQRYLYRYRKPKIILKQALLRHAPHKMVFRPKLATAQPVFQWLAEGGQLRPLVEKMLRYKFVPRDIMDESLKHPNWFLYSLLCYDLWHKMFIEGKVSTA
jgi:asparagine synthase (glutamine-hydrolysing)